MNDPETTAPDTICETPSSIARHARQYTRDRAMFQAAIEELQALLKEEQSMRHEYATKLVTATNALRYYADERSLDEETGAHVVGYRCSSPGMPEEWDAHPDSGEIAANALRAIGADLPLSVWKQIDDGHVGVEPPMPPPLDPWQRCEDMIELGAYLLSKMEATAAAGVKRGTDP
jgi:hypothetical protein